MLSTLYRLSHFNLIVALADSTVLSVLQISTEMLSNSPKFTKVVISGSRFVTHINSKSMLSSLSRGLSAKDDDSKYCSLQSWVLLRFVDPGAKSPGDYRKRKMIITSKEDRKLENKNISIIIVANMF